MSDNNSINLADDNFVRSVINRQVGKLIAKSDFTHQDRSDLVQEVYVRATKSLRLYDPSVGHLYPYVCTVVQRHLANVVRDRSVSKRATAGRVSLSKSVRGDDGGQVEMSQTLHHQDQDRRLGRERRLGEEELTTCAWIWQRSCRSCQKNSKTFSVAGKPTRSPKFLATSASLAPP